MLYSCAYARRKNNGEENQPEQCDLRLSDAFQKSIMRPEIELVCRVYNINKGKNKELLDRCPWLKEYMTFVNYVREFHRGKDDDNLKRAIDRCIEENVLKYFLIDRRSEVVKAVTLDYTFDRQLMLEREEARTEGMKEGLEEGKKALVSACKELGISYNETSEKVREKFSLGDEETEKSMQLYW